MIYQQMELLTWTKIINGGLDLFIVHGSGNNLADVINYT